MLYLRDKRPIVFNLSVSKIPSNAVSGLDNHTIYLDGLNDSVDKVGICFYYAAIGHFFSSIHE